MDLANTDVFVRHSHSPLIVLVSHDRGAGDDRPAIIGSAIGICHIDPSRFLEWKHIEEVYCEMESIS